ncbi:MAG TPA: 4-hydroxybenzoate octaprenyltransferase [Nitrospiraceae bacterium]|jgi:4-hydroxybenzoate polyprenyltransferase|nr:4-hydroxybenzoate octaprenyltransferase [Nitrospiraceae bacterium]
MNTFVQEIGLYLRMIKFSHSVFALPFALTGALLAASGIPSSRQIFWIVVAMLGARTGAMGLNRIVDRKIDKKNPRTQGREIPSGKIRLRDAAIFTAISLVVFISAAYNLNSLCVRLSPLAILVLILYSYTKRFTWMSHFVLGTAISFAPLGAWIAVRGTFDMRILPLSIAVIFWLAGFDVLYALQDMEFDRMHGLFSIPQKFGPKKALTIARLCHGLALLFLIATGLLFDRGVFYWGGMVTITALFLREHSLVKPDDLSKLNMAFFNMNGYISMTVFCFTLMDFLIWPLACFAFPASLLLS